MTNNRENSGERRKDKIEDKKGTKDVYEGEENINYMMNPNRKYYFILLFCSEIFWKLTRGISWYL